MHREAVRNTTVGGVFIRRGDYLAMSSHRMWSADHYEDPTCFHAFRFAERRKQPGLEHFSLLVSTSEDHTAFSHGKHACPGRYFAANEVKIAIVHLLLEYDFRLESADAAQWIERGVSMFVNPSSRLLIKR